MNELLLMQRKSLRAQEETETQHLKLGSDMDHLQNCYIKLKVTFCVTIPLFNMWTRSNLIF